MNFTSIFSYSLIVILLSSCSVENSTDGFSVGQCLEESRTNYASYFKQQTRIYKIDDIVGNYFKISLWYNESWQYQGEKNGNYFDNRGVLSYSSITCPGDSEDAAITDKIKGIELN